MTIPDAMLSSFVDVDADSHFSIHNLPFGVFRPHAGASPRIGVAIGNLVLDLSVVADKGLITGSQLTGTRVFHEQTLN